MLSIIFFFINLQLHDLRGRISIYEGAAGGAGGAGMPTSFGLSTGLTGSSGLTGLTSYSGLSTLGSSYSTSGLGSTYSPFSYTNPASKVSVYSVYYVYPFITCACTCTMVVYSPDFNISTCILYSLVCLLVATHTCTCTL